MYRFNDWQRHWREGDLPWTGEHANDVLVEMLPRLFARHGLKEGSSALVPLAGDSPAVPLLFHEKFLVTAIEYVPEAVERLKAVGFPNIKFERRELDKVVEFATPRIRILQQDIFTFSEKERFNFVYDRGAYVALSSEDRPRYAQIIAESIAPGGLLLTRTAELLGGEWKGPPYSITQDEMNSAFSSFELLEQSQETSLPTAERFSTAGVTEIRHLTCIFRKGA